MLCRLLQGCLLLSCLSNQLCVILKVIDTPADACVCYLCTSECIPRAPPPHAGRRHILANKYRHSPSLLLVVAQNTLPYLKLVPEVRAHRMGRPGCNNPWCPTSRTKVTLRPKHMHCALRHPQPFSKLEPCSPHTLFLLLFSLPLFHQSPHRPIFLLTLGLQQLLASTYTLDRHNQGSHQLMSVAHVAAKRLN